MKLVNENGIGGGGDGTDVRREVQGDCIVMIEGEGTWKKIR